jgi:hypothetical protein
MATAIQEQQAAAEADPSRQLSRLMGERMVAGAVTALDEPEQRERIKRLIDESVRQAVESAFAAAPIEELATDAARTATAAAMNEVAAALGPDGRLGASLIASSGRVSAAVVDSALASTRNGLAEIFPGCTGPDAAACRERRIQELTRAAGHGFAAGVRDSLAWPIVLVSMLAGCVAGILLHRAWSGRRARLKLRTA